MELCRSCRTLLLSRLLDPSSFDSRSSLDFFRLCVRFGSSVSESEKSSSGLAGMTMGEGIGEIVWYVP